MLAPWWVVSIVVGEILIWRNAYNAWRQLIILIYNKSSNPVLFTPCIDDLASSLAFWTSALYVTIALLAQKGIILELAVIDGI